MIKKYRLATSILFAIPVSLILSLFFSMSFEFFLGLSLDFFLEFPYLLLIINGVLIVIKIALTILIARFVYLLIGEVPIPNGYFKFSDLKLELINKNKRGDLTIKIEKKEISTITLCFFFDKKNDCELMIVGDIEIIFENKEKIIIFDTENYDSHDNCIYNTYELSQIQLSLVKTTNISKILFTIKSFPEGFLEGKSHDYTAENKKFFDFPKLFLDFCKS